SDLSSPAMARRSDSRRSICAADPSTVFVTPAQADSQSMAAFAAPAVATAAAVTGFTSPPRIRPADAATPAIDAPACRIPVRSVDACAAVAAVTACACRMPATYPVTLAISRTATVRTAIDTSPARAHDQAVDAQRPRRSLGPWVIGAVAVIGI